MSQINGGFNCLQFLEQILTTNKCPFFNLYFEAQQDLNTLYTSIHNTRGQTR
jgi:hypothetical protein